MQSIFFAVVFLLLLVSGAAAQSKFDIVYTSAVFLGGTNSKPIFTNIAFIINRQSNTMNNCAANLNLMPNAPDTLTVNCSIFTDYKSNFPASANVIARASPSPLPVQNQVFIWQVDTDTGAAEVCSMSNDIGPGQGCTSFTLQ